jgi:hypothetical protein
MIINIGPFVSTKFDSNFILIYKHVKFPHEMLSTIEVNR